MIESGPEKQAELSSPRSHGLLVPKQLSISSYDNSELSAHPPPR